MNNRRVLIVGGAGFIGSMVNKMLLKAGYHTVVFDNLSTGRQEAVLPETEFVEGDLADQTALQNLFQKHSFSAVMHFAAFTDVGESVVNPAKYYQNNVVNTLNLLDVMQEHQVKTFVFSSSAAVYGVPQCENLSESHPCLPINPYGETKAIVEKVLRDYEKAYGLKYSNLRYFNAAGGDPEGVIKNYKTKENNLIPLAINSLLQNTKTLTVFGTDYPTRDGTCVRDYIHVYDLGTAHILAMERLLAGQASSTYNLGNEHGFTVREVLSSIEKITGKKLAVHDGPRRAGDPPILVADATLAHKELGWQPRYPELDTIVAHAWQAKQR